MLVRAGDGEWLQLQPVDELPAGGIRVLCGTDAATLLELDEPLPVVAFSPDLGTDAAIDAICLTPEGGIALLVATFGEPAPSTLWRLMNAAGALRGATVDALASRCSELGGERSPARWLAARTGGNLHELDARIAEVLRTGAFELLLVTGAGAGALRTPLRFLQAGPAVVRVFEVEILRAGAVQAIEGIEVGVDGELDEPARREATAVAPPQPAPDVAHAPEPPAETPRAVTGVEIEPEPAPEPELAAPAAAVAEAPAARAAEPEAHAEPEAEVEPAPEPVQPLGEPSSEAAFLAAVDRLDHRSSSHMRFLHARLVELVADAVYTREGDVEFLVGWIAGEEQQPLVGLDSHGAFSVVLTSLPEHERLEFATEVAGLMTDVDGEQLLAAGVAELSVLEHLADETLMEYLVDNLVEALPGGRELFETATAATAEEEPLDDVGDDFFAGVSASHEDAPMVRELGEPTPATTPAVEQPAAAAGTPAEDAPAQDAAEVDAAPARGALGFGRRLRRRDAA